MAHRLGGLVARRLEGGVEDRLVEARVGGVQHGVGLDAAHQLDELGRARRVHALGRETGPLAPALRTETGSGPPRRSPPRSARSAATSASVTCSKTGRRWAIAANASPTP